MSDLEKLPRNAIITFVFFSVIWIGLSDWVVDLFPVELHQMLQTLKGWFYVAVVSIFMFALLKRSCGSANDLQDELQTAVHRLSAANSKKLEILDTIPVSVWEEDFSEVKKYIDEIIKPADPSNLRDWFNDNPQGAALLAGKVKIISVSGTTLEMFGASNEPQFLSNLHSIFTEKSLEAFSEEVIAFYGGKKIFNVEAEQKRLSGEDIITSTSARLSDSAESDWSLVIVSVEDISKKVLSKNAIDSFFELDMNLHIIASVEGIIIRINEGWTTALGYSRDELEGHTFLELVHPDDLERTLDELSELDTGKKTYYFENRYKHKNGSYRWLSWSAVVPVNGHIVYAVASDITDKKLAEKSLRDAAHIINSTSEGVMLTDMNGLITDVNQSFTSITGYDADEVLGQSPAILKSERHDHNFYKVLWESISSNGHWQGEIWNQRKSGEIYPEFLTINEVKDSDENVYGYAGIFSDLSHIKRAEDQLSHLTTHDDLTGLANRSLFGEQIQHAVKHANRSQKVVAIILLDLDNFKYINESLGFKQGDLLLGYVAERISHSLRSEDVVARISGDEFGILLENIDYSKQTCSIVEKVLDDIKKPFIIESNDIYLTASAGISLYPHDTNDPDLLTRNADTALSNAKENGKGSYQFYSAELTTAAFEYLLIENSLRTALEKDQFYLVYQPQFDLENQLLTGAEVLIRWQHPELGIVPPSKFIPIAERSSLINDIGEWVLRSACVQGKAWIDQGYDFGRLAVNLSGPQIISTDLVGIVESILAETQFPGSNLELEVTETYAMKDPASSKALLGELRMLGIEIAIDDFGTGYSSLNYLKNLPIDKLKIDQSFVACMGESSSDRAIVDAILSLGDALSLKTIAEGIETQEQLDLLLKKGCLLGQGYFYNRPIKPTEFEQLYLLNSKAE